MLQGGDMVELAHPAPAGGVRADVGIDLTHRIWNEMKIELSL